MSGEQSQSNDVFLNIISPEMALKLCRLCLEKKQTMWSFFSLLTFEDGSTLDVAHEFQKLTGENEENMKHPRFPSNICDYCVDLLVNASAFHQKYKESMQILQESIGKESEDFSEVVVKYIYEKPEHNDDINETVLPEEFVSNQQTSIAESKKSQRHLKGLLECPICKLHFSSSVFQKHYEGHKFMKNVVIKNEGTNNVSKKKADDAINSGFNDKEPPSPSKETITLTVSEEIPALTCKTEPKLHRCPICPKQFTALELKKHCWTHKALKTYLKNAPKYNKKVKFYATPRTGNKGLFNQEKILHTCPFCLEEFESEPFRDHIKDHRSEGNFRCSTCNRIFLGINHLKMHKLSHKKEAPYVCQACKKPFFLKRNFDFHVLKHNDDKELPFRCDYCEKTFFNPEHLKRHKFGHKNDIAYHMFYKRKTLYTECKKCLQKFKTEEERNVHSCKLSCAKCHKLFENKSKFNSHVCKNKLKRSQCRPCGKVFQLPSSFKTHKRRCNSRVLCYVCGRNVTNIHQHLQTHYPQKKSNIKFKCAQCDKQFSARVSLIRHINEVHSSIIRFYCQYCSKGFKGKWNLQVHERIHEGVKAHICNICDKGFLEKSYLKKHLRVHLRSEGLEEDNGII